MIYKGHNALNTTAKFFLNFAHLYDGKFMKN
jgi:hypothetical protein